MWRRLYNSASGQLRTNIEPLCNPVTIWPGYRSLKSGLAFCGIIGEGGFWGLNLECAIKFDFPAEERYATSVHRC